MGQDFKEKAKVMVDHFHNDIRRQINGQAKSMVVCKSIKNAIRYYQAFKEYLQEVDPGQTNFLSFPVEDLDKHLSKFWFAAKTKNVGHYMLGSLEIICHGLKRLIKESHKLDITKSEEFLASQKAWKDAAAELKKLGKGYTENTPGIAEEGLSKFLLFCWN